MSDREEGELDSGEEGEQSTNPPAETLVDSTLVENQKDIKMETGMTKRPQKSLKGSFRRRTPANAFNEIVNSNQKFVGRYANGPRFDNSTLSDFDQRRQDIPSSSYGDPLRVLDSWRQQPVRVDLPPSVPLLSLPPLRRPLLPTPLSISAPSFPRNSFAPPTFYPNNTLSTSTFAQNPSAADDGGLEIHVSSINSRVSEDMDISPSNSACLTPAADIADSCVMFVNSPIDVEQIPQPPPPPLDVPNLLFPSLSVTTQPSSTNDAELTADSRNNQAIESPMSDNSSLSGPKKYDKKVLDRMRQKLLENIEDSDDSSSVSTVSDLEDSINDYQKLKEQLMYHRDEMQNEVNKRNELLKKLDICQLMMTHHCQAMDKIMETVGDTTRKTLRYAKGSRGKIKDAERKKRTRIRDKFENRVNSMIRELSKVTESPPLSRPSTASSHSAKTPEAALHEEQGDFIPPDRRLPRQPYVGVPQSALTKKNVSHTFQKDALKRLKVSREGIAAIPKVSTGSPAKKDPQPPIIEKTSHRSRDEKSHSSVVERVSRSSNVERNRHSPEERTSRRSRDERTHSSSTQRASRRSHDEGTSRSSSAKRAPHPPSTEKTSRSSERVSHSSPAKRAPHLSSNRLTSGDKPSERPSHASPAKRTSRHSADVTPRDTPSKGTSYSSPVKTPQKDKSTAFDGVAAEKEVALRLKLLEQMKKKLISTAESNVVDEMEQSQNKTSMLVDKSEDEESTPPSVVSEYPLHPPEAENSPQPQMEKEFLQVPFETEDQNNAEEFTPNSVVADDVIVSKVTSELPPTVEEGIQKRISPTDEDIIELKKAFQLARKMKKLNKKKVSKSVIHTLNTLAINPASLSPSANQNKSADIVVSVPPVSLLTEQQLVQRDEIVTDSSFLSTPKSRPLTFIPRSDKENVAAKITTKRPASPPAKDISPKRTRSLAVQKVVNEREAKDLDVLFSSPRTAVRNFILSPEYPIDESLKRLRHRNDPNIDLCYFELFGTCIDEECPYQHERDYRLSDLQILEEVINYIPERVSRSDSVTQQAQQLLKTHSINEVIELLRKETSHHDLIKLAIEKATNG